MHDQLIHLITQRVSLSTQEREWCAASFQPVSITKNTIIEKAGKVPEYLYFIVSGYLRIFHLNEKGEEITTHINCPPGFITSYFNYINQVPSDENLESITDCQLLRITKTNLEELIDKSTAFKDFSISVFQESISYNENRSRELATLTAEQRYLKLIKEYPGIIQNVPLQYIASFLGMNSKSLSRIRKQVIR
ncbi:Crp/Fnr family transcriptional regulator [Elizabethkingia anophelis]|uniref:Crp/Fnr family transcriptional regulator n=1 Tax=Elizabethkingia anophelis TaxID=1117645 RepID=UPI000417CA9E|nr:Crp/Fnr family transcriptional regulator [Elizabethkingia anophelis]MCT3649457.1 Crp/Fnr family transcriptional regulator [Elizabethkingia anophelis]MCT3664360.1 Crp/Fnr family transcriptional regulator [Elizabethkingia anophelis]MCT3696589.1 Crp/Fnr family transcriptional regulator [Elizabethkingia anophelis]MCT3743826.1 Crp/Fnr family transcriptional regulator [Elizabethkingia anophelis]MCT3803186.1 Crp/Fnr family transcriptional regulator [Elizabethkingia anophelis]